MVKVKVCGLTNLADFTVAAESGADFAGVVLQLESKRFVSDLTWLAEARSANKILTTVAVFARNVQETPHGLFDIVQCEEPPVEQSANAFKVVRPRSDWPLQDWLAAAGDWPIVLLDPFHEGLAGGTGTKLDWSKAAEFVKLFAGKTVLAGGISPDNVALAVSTVQPWAVDACSGTEASPGKKDHGLVRAYVAAVKHP